MRTRNIYGGLTLAAAALLCLAGCKKDEEGEKITLGVDFEQTAGMQKTYIGNEDKTIYWSTDDSVKVNGKNYLVHDGVVEVKLSDDGYAAVYPKTGMLNGTAKNCTGGTVVIPATQNYVKNANGVQRLDAPMAARLDTKTGRLLFRNLYAVIKVTVQAADAPFTLNSITVKSTNEVNLAGTETFNFVQSIKTGKMDSVGITKVESCSTFVTLNFGTPVTIPQGETKDFYLYTVPFSGADLNVKLNGRVDNRTPARTNIAINRSQLRGTTVDVSNLEPMRFSVAEGKYVTFSPGNLQWSATGTHKVAGDGTAAGSWRFAEHQWDCIGSANSNISSTYTGWIDLFGWGTSGYNEKYPYMTSTTTADYGNGKSSNIAETYYDWGVYNAIYNPQTGKTDDPGTWRTLTNDEWFYLIETRTNASKLYKNGVAVRGKSNCLIIAPDNYTGIIKNSYDASAWSAAEAAGLVCLPAAGWRHGTTVDDVGSAGRYWSSTYYDDYNSAYVLLFYSENVGPGGSGNGIFRCHGLSVRLVKDVE